LLKSNASKPCNSCIALNDDLDKARDDTALLKSNASLPCVSCESLLAEIEELKLTQTTCVDQLEHARVKICEMKSIPCSMCSFILDDDVCPTSCDINDTLSDVNDDDCSCGLICTSCIEFENDVLALKQVRDDMSAKLVEHNDMSVRFEIEVDLVRTTFAKCIEEQVKSLRNALCGTCDRLKLENEFLSKRCNSLVAKSFKSHDSCHFDVGVSKITSFQPELISSVERECLDVSTAACASDSSSIAIPKLVASSGVSQDNSGCKSLSQCIGTHFTKPKFHCTFCKKDGHTVEFCFRRVKHERRVRARAFKKPHSLPNGTCDSKLDTKLRVDVSCSKSQGTSHLNENGNSSSRTVPVDRPLYHCF